MREEQVELLKRMTSLLERINTDDLYSKDFTINV